MIVLDDEVVVAGRREVVFDYLVDLRHLAELHGAVESAEWLGDATEGSLIRGTFRGVGREIVIDAEVTALQRPELLAIRSLTGPARVTAECRLGAFDRGRRTRLSVHAEVVPLGLFRFVEGSIAERLNREFPVALASVANKLEASLRASSARAARHRRQSR